MNAQPTSSLEPRIIPCLLLKNLGLVKGVKFKDHRYVGDPINAVRIFNSKEVDEILFLDITATQENRIPSPEFIQRIADQCLVPFAVGGGLRTLDQVKQMMGAGAEKVCLNTAALENPKFIEEIAGHFGSQSVMVSLDVKKSFFGVYEIFSRNGTQKIKGSLEATVQRVEAAGAGEILLNCIDRDGTRQGFDLELLRRVAKITFVPMIASGGAGEYGHLKTALTEGHADAVAAGSLFVFHGRRQGVLISYPSVEERKSILL